MMFVDGENWTIQAEDVAKSANVPLIEGPFYRPHVYMWFPGEPGTAGYAGSDSWSRDLWAGLASRAVRAYYYTSTTGGEQRAKKCREALWHLDFTPHVFTKPAGTRSKEVDITLASDLLGHAYGSHFDTAVLVAGDRDYVPLVHHLKRLGKVVVVIFFRAKVSPELRLAADQFSGIDDLFASKWHAHHRVTQESGQQPSPPDGAVIASDANGGDRRQGDPRSDEAAR
jgi:hypothetical protein